MQGLLRRGGIAIAAMFMCAGMASDAMAQSRAAQFLRDTQYQAFRSSGLSTSLVDRYITFRGVDLATDRFGGGGSIQLSVGTMFSAVPQQNRTYTANYMIYNDTSENICVRAKVRERNAPFAQRIVNDEYSFIIPAGGHQALMFFSTELRAGESLQHFDVTRNVTGVKLVFWLADMSQPAGDGSRCDVTEPLDLDDWLAAPSSNAGQIYDVALNRRLGRLIGGN